MRNYLLLLQISIGLIFSFLINIKTINAKIKEADSVYIKEVQILGLKKTRTLVIQRELSLKPNTIISRRKLLQNFELDKGRLNYLMLFKKTDCNLDFVATDTVIVKFILTESFRYVGAPILQLSDRNFNTWFKTYNAAINRLNYGAYVNIKNINGLNQLMAIEFQNGFNRLYALGFQVPRLRKVKNWGIGSRIQYMDVKTYPIDIENNAQRFYKNDSSRIFRELQAVADAYYKPDVSQTHKFSIGLADIRILEEVAIQNPNLLGAGTRQIQYAILKYKYTRARNNSPVYPTAGTRLEVEARYNGLPMGPSNNKIMQAAVEMHYGYYKPMTHNIFGAITLRGALAHNNGAFYNTKALGYLHNTVRAYEYYIIHGSHFGIARLDLKYKIIDKTIVSKKFKSSLPFAIYPKIFSDYGYAYATDVSNNALSNTLLRSVGVGVDFHVNNNQMLRVEYGINHLKQKGLFLNLIAL